MDLIFQLMCIILIVIIYIVKVFNTINTTSDLDQIRTKLSKIDPTIEAFCLGIEKSSGKYLNVLLDRQTGKCLLRKHTYPFSKNGQPIALHNHGSIEDLKNGYSISGIERVAFKCPIGYHGSLCNISYFCDSPQDDFKFKWLTFNQFEMIELANGLPNPGENHSQVTPDDSNIVPYRGKEQVHSRIRIYCQPNNKHILQACNNDELLNEKLNCEKYDICEDHINGYKHNYPIFNDIIDDKTYYICKNNKSEKRECGDGMVFSLKRNGCIVKSSCYKSEKRTHPRDANSYIQCDNDIGTIIQCAHGVIEQNNELSCQLKSCIPKDLTYEDENLRYIYGHISCNDKDEPVITKCDNSSSNPKTYSFKWDEEFQFQFKQWPNNVLDTKQQQCVNPTDGIIYNPIVNLRWSDAMNSPHPFNIKTLEYICPDTSKFRWDYINEKTIPRHNDEWVDTGAPCQDEISRQPWGTLTRIPIGGTNNKMPLLVGVKVEQSLHSISDVPLWPHYNRTEKKFQQLQLIYDYNVLNIVVGTSEIALPGFKSISDANGSDATNGTIVYLKLLGYKAGIPPNIEVTQYYNIVSGQFDLPKFPKYATVKSYTKVDSIPLTKSEKYPIFWALLTDKLSKIKNTEIEISNTQIVFNNTSEGATFDFLNVTYAAESKIATLTYRNLVIPLNTTKISSLNLPYTNFIG